MTATPKLRLAFKRRPRTRAFVEGLVGLQGTELSITDAIEDSTVRHNLIRSGELDGGEMSASGLFRSRLRGESLLALPVYVKRGFNQRHVVCREDAPFASFADLRGKRIGLRYGDSSVTVWLRGIFADEAGIQPTDVTWVTTDGADQPGFWPDQRVEAVAVEEGLENPGWRIVERIEGEERTITPQEVHLCWMLLRGEIDALWTTTFLSGPGLRTVYPDCDAAEADYYRRTRLYPINHVVVLQERVVRDRPDLAPALVGALRRARDLALQWLSPAALEELEHERARLEGREPFNYAFTDEEEHVLRTFMRYQHEQGLLPEQFPVEALFVPGVRDL